MSTIRQFERSNIKKTNPMWSPLRAIVESPFYRNNVVDIENISQAYNLAVQSPGTIITGLPVYKPETFDLPHDAKVLIFNNGSVTGRAAAARRIVGDVGVDEDSLNKKVMAAVYQSRFRKMYHAQAFVGLDPAFMVRAHLLIPEGHENLLYNWLLNFQPCTPAYEKMYAESRNFADEGDIYVFADPTWSHPDHPLGLTYFDSAHNCAAILGMSYFGELKKGTLTLAWSIADRHGFAACHGGCKVFKKSKGDDPKKVPLDQDFTLAVFGLSGSGKSTLTHAKHDGKYEIYVLHDDALIINTKEKYSIAMEPSYFDKTNDYPTDSPANKYLLTMQNVGATLDQDGLIVPVTEDLRNKNGRAIKSKLWSDNRVDRLDSKISAVGWIMKDPLLPPLVKVDDPVIAALMGCTLMTKRTSAERLAKGVDPDQLVIEPYANPFRTYPLSHDYKKFLSLFEGGVDCFILNTGYYGDTKVPKEDTLALVEKMVERKLDLKNLPGLKGFSYELPAGFKLLDSEEDRKKMKETFQVRLHFLMGQNAFNALPEEALSAFKKLVDSI